VAFAPDGRTLATVSDDQTVRLWDLTGQGPTSPSWPAPGRSRRRCGGGRLCPRWDGRTLATASGDKTVRLWDLSNRDQPGQLGEPLAGHTNVVYGVAFAPDGRTLATASGDQTARLWDLSNRDQPRQLGQPLTGHTNAVTGVAFAPDGGALATASGDQTARLWQLPRFDGLAGGEVREACLRAGGPLDELTWEQYARGVSYQDTCAGR
jgi:eukaryotic-like serine/threonine-protein kinase